MSTKLIAFPTIAGLALALTAATAGESRARIDAARTASGRPDLSGNYDLASFLAKRAAAQAGQQ